MMITSAKGMGAHRGLDDGDLIDGDGSERQGDGAGRTAGWSELCRAWRTALVPPIGQEERRNGCGLTPRCQRKGREVLRWCIRGTLGAWPWPWVGNGGGGGDRRCWGRRGSSEREDMVAARGCGTEASLK